MYNWHGRWPIGSLSLKDKPVTELNLHDPQIYKPEHSIFMGLPQISGFKNFSMMETLARGSIPGI